MASARGEFSSRFGFIMAAAGSAVGLGNIWGFPTQAASNGGAAFLLVYGALSFKAALGPAAALEPAETGTGSLGKALATCLALTWLNPHVYLDTVVLLGSISTQYEDAQVAFGAGAVTSSFVFFFSLGYGARLLRPLFAKPSAWRVLEIVVGVTMWAIAAKLVFGN